MGLQDTTNITKSRDKKDFLLFILNINPRVQDESSIFLLNSSKIPTKRLYFAVLGPDTGI